MREADDQIVDGGVAESPVRSMKKLGS